MMDDCKTVIYATEEVLLRSNCAHTLQSPTCDAALSLSLARKGQKRVSQDLFDGGGSRSRISAELSLIGESAGLLEHVTARLESGEAAQQSLSGK